MLKTMQGPLDRSSSYIPLLQVIRLGRVERTTEVICVSPPFRDIVIGLAKESAGVTVVAEKGMAGLFAGAGSVKGVRVVDGCKGLSGKFGAAVIFEGIKGLGCLNDLIKDITGSLLPGSRALLIFKKLSPSQAIDGELDELMLSAGLRRLAVVDLGFFFCAVYERSAESSP